VREHEGEDGPMCGGSDLVASQLLHTSSRDGVRRDEDSDSTTEAMRETRGGGEGGSSRGSRLTLDIDSGALAEQWTREGIEAGPQLPFSNDPDTVGDWQRHRPLSLHGTTRSETSDRFSEVPLEVSLSSNDSDWKAVLRKSAALSSSSLPASPLGAHRRAGHWQTSTRDSADEPGQSSTAGSAGDEGASSTPLDKSDSQSLQGAEGPQENEGSTSSSHGTGASENASVEELKPALEELEPPVEGGSPKQLPKERAAAAGKAAEHGRRPQSPPPGWDSTSSLPRASASLDRMFPELKGMLGSAVSSMFLEGTPPPQDHLGSQGLRFSPLPYFLLHTTGLHALLLSSLGPLRLTACLQ